MKTVLLGIQYGLEALSLAIRAGISLYEAAEILARMRARFRRYEEYCASVADHAGLDLTLTSEFGWRVKVPPGTNRRTIRNWPIQTCGSEIMHIAMILAERRGISIVAPVHDAFMAESDLADIHDTSRALDRCMRDASAIVLRGYEIPTDEGEAIGPHMAGPRKGPILPGERYYDKNGIGMWNKLNELIDNLVKRQA
jgi:DNA polymerase I-like protein with 3'-5' exonuclease and polymerase domains